MANIDYNSARKMLNVYFERATSELPTLANVLLAQQADNLNIVFDSNTQSYREVLLGCALIHILDQSVNIRLPYVKQGQNAYNGRTFDEQVINPFLLSKQIPCSKGPYLATFRRNVRLDITTREGLRDKIGYDAMLEIISRIEQSTHEESEAILLCLLKKFIELRERADIALISIDRLSIGQHRFFLDSLLHNQSGGLIPMLVTEAIFDTINEEYNCNWTIVRQGINSADGATGAAGDITISKDGHILKAIEVTERPIGEVRVRTTFNTKITTLGVKDYLFVYTSTPPDDDAYKVAQNYFALGHDINFIKLTNFVTSVFIAGTESTRRIFINKMLLLLQQRDVPASVKTAWNDALQATVRS